MVLAESDIGVVILSRKRPHNMRTIRGLLPRALVCIDEREEADYAGLVPKEQLILHPPLDGVPRVWNWIIENLPHPVLFKVDDDMTVMRWLVPPERYVRDPDEIMAVIHNGAQVCADLGLGVFCFNPIKHPMMLDFDRKPIRATGPAAGIFGVVNAARHRPMRVRFGARAQIDWTMLALLYDRAIFTDLRYCFDAGLVFSGAGGNSSLYSTAHFSRVTKLLKEEWGRYLTLGQQGNRAYGPGAIRFAIKVTRRNSRAQA
jgi:hypothetical protein